MLDVGASKVSRYVTGLMCGENGRSVEKGFADAIFKFGRIAAQSGPKYYEIVKDSWNSYKWVVVQAAAPKIGDVGRPNVKQEDMVFETKKVVGSAIVRTEGVLHIDADRMEDLEMMKIAWAYDREHRGYLVLVTGRFARDFMPAMVEVDALENKAAVVFCVDQIEAELASHLNGRLRAVGVPVLAVERIWSNAKEDSKFLVYADEWAESGPTGFVARR